MTFIKSKFGSRGARLRRLVQITSRSKKEVVNHAAEAITCP